jgi:hypothetical protein
MTESPEDSKKESKSRLAYIREILETLPRIFEAELKSAFGKFNLIMGLIALILAVGFTIGYSPLTNFLAFYVVIIVGLFSFVRIENHKPKRIEVPKRIGPRKKRRAMQP